MGLVILAALALYFLISIAVVVGAALFANHRGRSGWRWGVAAALVMYLIPFWDWLPTIAMHRYYCATEAGFWVYKSVDQWKAENPGVLETLMEDKSEPFRRVGDDKNRIDTKALNRRFRWVIEKRRPFSVLPVDSWKSEIVDGKNSEVVARYVDFSSGEGRDNFKFWMNISNCSDGISNRNAFGQFVETILNINKDKTK